MLKLYAHPASVYSLRVQFFLEEIGEPYEYIRINLEKAEHFRKPYEEVNPFKRVPAIEIGGFRLSESNAILRYLSARCARYDWYPINLEERAVVDQWIDYTASHAGLPLSHLAWERFWKPKFGQKADPVKEAEASTKLLRELPMVERRLQEARYLAGTPGPTLADASFLPMVFYAELAKHPLTPYPALQGWYDRMRAREAWRKVVANVS